MQRLFHSDRTRFFGILALLHYMIGALLVIADGLSALILWQLPTTGMAMGIILLVSATLWVKAGQRFARGASPFLDLLVILIAYIEMLSL